MWFVHENLVMWISFVLTMILAIRLRRIINKKIEIPNPTGGVFIDQCIDPDSAYEVIDAGLKIVIRRMLDSPSDVRQIISGPVLILTYFVSQKFLKQVTILDINFQ